MDALNEEYRAFVINLQTDYCKGGPTKALYMLDLLKQFDPDYYHIKHQSPPDTTPPPTLIPPPPRQI
jgi:hypothetical protein